MFWQGMSHKIVSALFLLVFIVGCEQQSSDNELSRSYATRNDEKVLSSGEKNEKKHLTTMSQASNLFTFKLFKQMALSNQKKNMVASPESILSVSAMMWLGASHETRNQLTQALFSYSGANFAVNDSLLCKAMQQSLNRESSSKQSITVKQANGLWVQEGFKIKSEYQQQLQRCFNSELHTMNMSKPAQDINAWVKTNTQGMIPHLLKPTDINASTRLVLVDTLFFEGDWSNPFKKGDNQNLSFYVNGLGDSDNKITMMTDESANYQYTDNAQWQVLAKDYVGQDAALIVFLPKKGGNLSNLLQSNQAEDFLQLLNHLSDLPGNTLIDLQLPKFTTSTTSDLIPLFKQLGVVDLFSKTKADLSNTAKIENNHRLYVSLFLQKAKVLVNEQGTKAAAATVAVESVGSYLGEKLPPPPTIIKFYANHPFLYLIYDKQHKEILFIGQYVKPEIK